MSWTDTALEIIAQQRSEHPEMTPQEQRKFCSQNYPFAQRMGWAYKAWCKAMRRVFGEAPGHPCKVRHPVTGERVRLDEATPDLFGEKQQ